jgi:arsenate reductase (thioredoxin)
MRKFGPGLRKDGLCGSPASPTTASRTRTSNVGEYHVPDRSSLLCNGTSVGGVGGNSGQGTNELPETGDCRFVCLHGSVKSQMAAVHFNRLAKERGLPFVALSRGIEVDAILPAGIRQGLAAEGLAPVDDTPRPLVAEEASGAVKVFAFDYVPSDRRGSANIIYWSDVPPATKDYNAARDAIVRHVEEVVTSLSDK